MAIVDLSSSRSIQPPAGQSVSERLAAVVNEYRRAYGLRVELWTSGGEEDIGKGQGDAIIHIVREALALIKRFSPTAVCRIRLRFNSRPFTLEIVDEGSGLADPAADEYALLGIKARAAGIMAHVEVVTTPGVGTTLFVFGPRRRLPLPANGG